MTNSPVYAIGDIIELIPSLPGQTVSKTQFTVIATYYDAVGFWHAVESTDPSGQLVQTAMNDGGPYSRIVGHRAVAAPPPLPAPAPRPVAPPPTWTPPPPPAWPPVTPPPPQHAAPHRSWWQTFIDWLKGWW